MIKLPMTQGRRVFVWFVPVMRANPPSRRVPGIMRDFDGRRPDDRIEVLT